ncbi:DUF5818 domain-containing protein [Sphingomonas sp. KC8]|uniref:DUF5818 domain-containing protein n=1 Tax=Sphingomonas sp. KC8 TaxID=1030157 RepID=UPI000248B8B6|nr:DUF5818 domain-containing protein [Sphingomonas sp. KC8]ARS28477.1 hypothetical protein KC8_14440 [Sphingomonas sp. KC8]
MNPGDAAEASGLLIRDGGGFVLKCDGGGVWRLDLPRTPVDLVEKRVRVSGIRLPDGRIEASAIRPD